MTGEAPRPGQVLRYPYLWAWQQDLGETEGRKPRPCAVAITLVTRDGETVIFLLAITSKQPGPTRLSIEVPEIERRRVGLHENAKLWVIIDEFNSDIVERSYYLEPGAQLGQFSAHFTRQLQRLFADGLRSKNASMVKRD